MIEPTQPAWIAWVFLTVLAVVLLSWSHYAGRLWNGKAPIPYRRQRRVPWFLEGASLASLLLLGAFLTVLAQLNADPTAPSPEPMKIGIGIAVSQLITFALFAGGVIVWLTARYGASQKGIHLEDFGLGGSDEQQVRDLGLGVLACAAMLPLVYGFLGALTQLLGEPTPHPSIRSLLSDPSAETIASSIILAVVSAPLFEELAFRVLLQGGMQRLARRDAWWPIVVSATAFALAHTNQGFAPAPIFVLALGLGYVYRQTHSYPAVVAMHMAFNGLSLATAIASGQGGTEL